LGVVVFSQGGESFAVALVDAVDAAVVLEFVDDDAGSWDW
jgi:hypothetical protein